MPSTPDSVDVPPEAVAVGRQYHRHERPVSYAFALLIVAIAVAAIVVFPFLTGLLVAGIVVALVRIPIVRGSGVVRLSTDADTATVQSAFRSATPPILAFQWGLADTIRASATAATYDLSYLFGLRSVSISTEVSSIAAEGSAMDAGLELTVTANGQPWATYQICIYAEDGGTIVDIEWTSDRRFGLRRLPQWLVAEHYRADALSAQGYIVAERDASLSL